MTLTLASFTDTNTIIVNGLTYTGESTANTANWAGRKFCTAGATDTADALAFANLLNTDYVIATDGSITVGVTIVVTTNEGAVTFTAAAAPDYPNHIFDQSGDAAAEVASIVLAINHKDNVTCATSVDGDTVTVTLGDGTEYVFTSAGAEDLAAGEFDNDAGDDAAATSLAACINDATYGVPGVTATALLHVVSLARDSIDDTFTLTSSDGTTLAVEAAGGVPGVLATAGPLTAGEVGIAPVWVSTLTVTETGSDLTVTDIDCPGVYASPASAVVTLTPGMPGAPTGQELATVISATSAANCTVAQAATLAGLYIDTAAAAANTGATNHAATTGTAGSIFTQAVGGADYCYLGFTADNATPQAVSVSAIKRI